MGQSFEAGLTARSSKETFKKAKSLLKSEELLCCHEISQGVLRAVFRDSKNNVARTEVTGFPRGPYSAVCSCGAAKDEFCAHAVAACLQHAKFTIKQNSARRLHEAPAEYAGLKFKGLPELLKQVLVQPEASVEINAESDFPHTPSKWERTIFQVDLTCGGRKYAGNLNNLRQLHFGKTLSVSLKLEAFPQQDRQIIRYLAINAQQEGAKLSLDAEQTAEFFHCLTGFERFLRMKEKVVVHKNHAELALLVEDDPAGGTGCILRSAIIVKGVPLPLKDVKVVAGRAGCWVGMLGEYWWISARADVLWIRNFLRTTVQPCDKKSAEVLLCSSWLPLKVIESRKVKVTLRKFKPFYDGMLRPDGALEIEVLYDYSGHLCRGDQERYASNGGGYWLRDTLGEEAVVTDLQSFGFELMKSGRNAARVKRLLLRDREAVGMFVDEVIPAWLRNKREFSMSSGLASLCGNASALSISCRVVNETPEYFDIEVGLESGGTPVRWKTVADAALRNELFMTPADGGFIKMTRPIARLASGISGVANNVPQSEMPSGPGTSVFDRLRLARPAAFYWAKLADGIPGAIPAQFLRLKLELEDAVTGLEKLPDVKSDIFKGDLRNYQMQGLKWLSVMGGRGCNLVLADEMGLGKTIQALALLASGRDSAKTPSMVICPTSLIENWAREAARFTPSMKTLVISGNDRRSLWRKAPEYDLCITSYSLVRRDIDAINAITFDYLILDEAQHIKNPATANAQTCKEIAAAHKLVLTGTPLENSPEDLWSIFDFLHTGLLGSLSSFRNKYVLNPASDANRDLAERIAPFMLRRKKADVNRELPPKLEQSMCCEMGQQQRDFYDRFLNESRRIFSSMRDPGCTTSRFEMLSSLLRLRQICCDPGLLPPTLTGGTAGDVPGSAKMELLKEVMMESVDSGHKVLVFSQFTSLLKIVRSWMDSQKLRYEYLDGSTVDRMAHVDNFNGSPDIPVFLLSLKAGGVGLNLTSADTVIIYDPWWNPAAEMQAADRTHRIGQTKSVNCIKLIVKNSIEEKVLELQKRKAAMFEDLVESPTEAMRRITLEDLEFLLD